MPYGITGLERVNRRMPHRGVNRRMPHRGVNRRMPHRGVNRRMPHRGVNRLMPHPVDTFITLRDVRRRREQWKLSPPLTSLLDTTGGWNFRSPVRFSDSLLDPRSWLKAPQQCATNLMLIFFSVVSPCSKINICVEIWISDGSNLIHKFRTVSWWKYCGNGIRSCVPSQRAVS